MKQGQSGKGKHLDLGIMSTTFQALRGFEAEIYSGKGVERIQDWIIRAGLWACGQRFGEGGRRPLAEIVVGRGPRAGQLGDYRMGARSTVRAV